LQNQGGHGPLWPLQSSATACQVKLPIFGALGAEELRLQISCDRLQITEELGPEILRVETTS